MFAYVQTLIGIALRKLGPEDLPDSSFLVFATLVVYAALQFGVNLRTFGPTSGLVITVIAAVGMPAVALWLLLRFTGFQARYRQTYTALLGTGALLSIALLPLDAWLSVSLENDSGAATLPLVGMFALILWSLSIDGHILSRAISRSYLVGVGLSIAYFLLYLMVFRPLLPSPVVE